MARRWGGPYKSTGSAEVFAGETVKLWLVLRDVNGDEQDYAGRDFVQRLFDASGAIVGECTATVETGVSSTAASVLQFLLSSTITADALPEGQGWIALQHRLIETFDDGGEYTWGSHPFNIEAGDVEAIEPVEGGPETGPATQFTVTVGSPILEVAFIGGPGRTGASAMQVLIDGGFLPSNATVQDYLDLLQQPANEAGETVLEQITQAGLDVTGPGGTIDQAVAAVVAPGGTLDQAVDAFIAEAAEPGGSIDVAIEATLVPAQAALVATGDAQEARLEDRTDELLQDLSDSTADLATSLSAAASARVFDNEADLLAGLAEGELGFLPETYGQKAVGYVDKSGVAVRGGRTQLLGGGAESVIWWAAIQSAGAPPQGTVIDINFLDLSFSNGRWARNKLATPPPVLFTFITSQTVTVDAPGNASLDFWATKRHHEDEAVYVEVEVTEAVTAAANGTVTFSIIESDASDLSSPTTLVSTAAIAKGNLTLGTKVLVTIPANQSRRYLGVYFDVGSGPLTAGKFSVRTRCDTAKPSLNYFVFDQPPFRNQGSGPTLGAVSGTYPTKVQQITFGTNNILNLNGSRRVTESGMPWIMEVTAEGGAGSGGGQVHRYGPSTAYATSPTLAEGVAQTYSTVFNGTDNGFPAITTTSGGTANIGLRRIRAAPGTILPDWSDQHQGHAFSSFKRAGGLGRKGSVLDGQGDGLNKATIVKNPGLARTVYDPKRGMTMFCSVYIPAGSGGNDIPIVTPIYDNSASPTIASATMAIMLDTFSGTVGELSMRPNQSSSFEKGYQEPKAGWHILALRMKQNGVSLWYDGVPILRSYAPWQGMELMGFWLNAYAGTFNMQPTTTAFAGNFQTFTEIPYALTDEAMLLEFSRHRSAMAICGRQLEIDEWMFCAPGSSRTAWSSLPSWFWQLALTVRPVNADGSNRFQGMNCANGGSSYHNIDPAISISSVTRASNVVTIVTTTPHLQSSSTAANIAGINDDSFNGTYLPTIVNSTTFTYAQTGPDATSHGGTVTAHRTDFFTVLEREVIPFIRGRRWAGGKSVVFMPDSINDADYIGKVAGAAAPSGAPSWWNTALSGAQNVYDGYMIPYAEAVRAEMSDADLLVSYDAMPRFDSFGNTSGYTEVGRDAMNALLRASTWLDYVDKHIDFIGTNWATGALANAAGYFNADNLHDSPTGSLAMANHINDNFVKTLP